ncbi:hypothetical protein LOD99_5912 [Oopsacas minuta]|uniref:trans-L-3-hydroxyproline dehydratase n=1 Tax=Oopsacas minuta TaxID=111878 RepID=A0AAV7JNH4_9METZ|nr:hypothetical protein LOD99_5912 [Oopsacas minuta]
MASGAQLIGQDILETLEMHTCLEPVRIIQSGYPNIEGTTILEKRQFVTKHLDHLRTRLICEPRGSRAMYGVIPVKPDLPNADMAVLFMHNEGYSTMCGHAVIALGRYAIDYGIVPAVAPETKVNIQCPCGLVTVFVEYSEGKSGRARFISVPSYIFSQDSQIELPGYGVIHYDIAYGGAFYAVALVTQFGLDLKTSGYEALRSAAASLTELLRKTIKLQHTDSDLAFLYGTILIDENDNTEEICNNFVVFGDAQVDRSPCGSGTTARIAIQFYKHNLKLGQQRMFTGPSGGKFIAQAVKEESIGAGKNGIIVEVSGHGYYSGMCRFSHESDDPFCDGKLMD